MIEEDALKRAEVRMLNSISVLIAVIPFLLLIELALSVADINGTSSFQVSVSLQKMFVGIRSIDRITFG
ncbi:MAG: hypothetical protein IH840_04525 [Candidatus Heimdallarchaeota archaeon]|nr:hypothetical protein [Candidatus Heimdallarchaeota archaeon]